MEGRNYLTPDGKKNPIKNKRDYIPFVGEESSGESTEGTDSQSLSAVGSTSLPEQESIPEDLTFKEREYENRDPLEYKYDKSDPGYVLIINQRFRGSKERFGTEMDEIEILTCFNKLGYNIDSDHILNDATIQDLKNKVEACKSKLENMNCLIVFVLSHGRGNDLFEMSDGPYSVHALIEPFLEVEALKNKPKIFILQACKTDEYKKGDEKKIQLYADSALKQYPNVLVVYSTVEGTLSYRDKIRGSVFIQQLCRTIYMHGMREDFISILMRCNKSIAAMPLVELRNDDAHNPKQTPLFISTLKKHFYICRSKDRRFQLNHLHNLKDLISKWKGQINLDLGKKKSSGARPSSSTAPVTLRRNSMEKIEFDSNIMPKLVKPTTSVTPVTQNPTKPRSKQRSRLSSLSKQIDSKSPKKWQY